MLNGEIMDASRPYTYTYCLTPPPPDLSGSLSTTRSHRFDFLSGLTHSWSVLDVTLLYVKAETHNPPDLWHTIPHQSSPASHYWRIMGIVLATSGVPQVAKSYCKLTPIIVTLNLYPKSAPALQTNVLPLLRLKTDLLQSNCIHASMWEGKDWVDISDLGVHPP